jgi:hypothetical protein
MLAVQTLEVPKERVPSARDLKSPVISVARTTLCHSSLRLADPYFAVIVSAQIVPLSRELSCRTINRVGIKAAVLLTISRDTGAPLNALLRLGGDSLN